MDPMKRLLLEVSYESFENGQSNPQWSVMPVYTDSHSLQPVFL